MNGQLPVSLRLIVNDGDDSEFRDRLSRELVSECAELGEQLDATLWPGEEPGEGHRALEIVQIGQIAVEVLPNLIPALVNKLAEWIKRDADRDIEIELGDGRRVKCPADTSPEKLEALVVALQAEATPGTSS